MSLLTKLTKLLGRSEAETNDSATVEPTQVSKNGPFTIKVEEPSEGVLRATAKTGNRLFGYEDVPFEIYHYNETQTEEYAGWEGSLSCITGRPRFDTLIRYPDRDIRYTRSYWYRDGDFIGFSAVCRDYGYAKQAMYVEPHDLKEDIIKKYDPIISALERIVGKTLINRNKSENENND